MWVADKWEDYELLETSGGERLERWGKHTLLRPDPQVIWKTPREHKAWQTPDAAYKRSSSGGGGWSDHKLPGEWKINYGGLSFWVKPMSFKHVGLFPEQAANWDACRALIKGKMSILNLLDRKSVV